MYYSLPPSWLLSTPRSGTTLVASWLQNIRAFKPKHVEHYNPVILQDSKLSEKIPKHNKCFLHHFEKVHGHRDLNIVSERWPNIKWLRVYRGEPIAQTVSSYIAASTGVWHSRYLKEGYSEMEVDVNASRLYGTYTFIQAEEKEVQHFLASQDHLTVEYANIVQNPLQTFQEICDWLEVPQRYISEKYLRRSQVEKLPDHPLKQELTECLEEYIRNKSQ